MIRCVPAHQSHSEAGFWCPDFSAAFTVPHRHSTAFLRWSTVWCDVWAGRGGTALDDGSGAVFTRVIEHVFEYDRIWWCGRCCCDSGFKLESRLVSRADQVEHLRRRMAEVSAKIGTRSQGRVHTGDPTPASESLLEVPETLAESPPPRCREEWWRCSPVPARYR